MCGPPRLPPGPSGPNNQQICLFSVLHYACKGEDPALVRLLLDKKCDPRQISTTRKSALHFAAELGHTEQVQLLLDEGAYVDCQTEADSATPLILAVKSGHHAAAQILLDAGANPNHNSYVSPLRLA